MKEDSRDQLLILMKIPFPSSRAVRSQLVLALIQITTHFPPEVMCKGKPSLRTILGPRLRIEPGTPDVKS